MGRLHYFDNGTMVPVNSSSLQGITTTSPSTFGLPNTNFFGAVNQNRSANVFIAWPFYVSQAMEVTDYAFKVVSNGNATDTTVRCGIYQKNEDMTSDGLVTEFTATTVGPSATGTFVTSVGTPYRLDVGEYYIATNQTATLQYQTPRPVNNLVFLDSAAILLNGAYAPVTATNPLPAAFPAVTFLTVSTPIGPHALLRWNNL